MAQKWQRIGRRYKYLNDFVEGPDGKYVYIGRVYGLDTEATTAKKELAALWLYIGAASVLHIAAGSIPASGMLGAFYVVIPYMFAIFGLGLSIWALSKYTEGRNEMREYIFGSVQKLPLFALITAASCALMLLGEIIYVILHGFEGKALLTAAIVALECAAGALALLTKLRYDKYRWKALVG